MRDQAVRVVERRRLQAQVVSLNDPRACEVEVVGGKAARLAAALRAGFPVPNGFVVLAADDCTADAIEGPLAALGDHPVAVRSSAVDEDGAQASFAGQHRTILSVRGAEEVASAVRACAASVDSDEARFYRDAVGAPGSGKCAVFVQKLVPADRSMVAFTVDPVGGRPTVVVEACLGLGEPLVSGSATPDTYVIDAAAHSVVQRHIAHKETMLMTAGDSLEDRDVSADLQDAPVLSDREAVETARLALELESLVGGAVDIEASYSDGRLHLLQARPVTAAERTDAFRVTWSDARDAELGWGRNPANFPVPVSPLHASYLDVAFVGGINGWQAEEGIPAEIIGRRINTYWYMAELPTAPVDASRNLDDAIANLADLWQRHYLPEIEGHLEAMHRFDLIGASTPDLLAHLDDVLERATRIWTLHFLLLTPILVALHEFESFCSERFSETGLGASDLLRGLDNETARMTRELVALGEKLCTGADLTEDLHAFLSRYGARSEGLELMLPAWSENESAVMALIRIYSSSLSVARGEEAPASSATIRVDAVHRAREALHDLDGVSEVFDAKLAAAQVAAVLSEDHAFHIDYPLRLAVRRVFLELGNRLSRANVVDRPGDVFMLDLEELREAASSLGSSDLSGLVLARRSEMARWERVAAPATIGVDAPDGEDISDGEDDRISQAYASFLGTGGKRRDSGAAITGKAASPGQAVGVARVLRGPDEISRLAPGDVLVVSTTSPMWTPVFRVVSAVVTDIGGTLSHAAIVARELGIPAVVATGVATQVIADGQRVQVDGSRGSIRLL
nr:hypothetical protein [Actinomycetota bacterium]